MTGYLGCWHGFGTCKFVYKSHLEINVILKGFLKVIVKYIAMSKLKILNANKLYDYYSNA